MKSASAKMIALALCLAIFSAGLLGCAAEPEGAVYVRIPGSFEAESTPVPTEEPTPVQTAAPLPAATVPAQQIPLANNTPDLIMMREHFSTMASEPSPSPVPSAESTQEPTPAPTPKPTATPAPTPAFTVTKLNLSGYVTADEVNLRSGPDRDYEIVGELDLRDEVLITGMSGEWYRLTSDEGSGYVLSDYVKQGSAPTPTPKPTATPQPTATPEPTPSPTPAPPPSPTQPPVPVSTSTPSFSVIQGIPGSYTDSEIWMAAQLVYLEGKGSSQTDYEWIANVLWNRCNSRSYGGTIEEEIFRSGQFTVTKDREEFLATTPSSSALAACQAVFLEGKRVIPENVLYFRSASRGTSWGKRTFYAEMGGNNYFY